MFSLQLIWPFSYIPTTGVICLFILLKKVVYVMFRYVMFSIET